MSWVHASGELVRDHLFLGETIDKRVATPGWQQSALKMLLKVGGEKLLMKTGMIEQMAMENFKYMPFTQFANVTGVPAMSVPLHWCDSGLPLGSQFVGGHGDEGKLLALAGQLEEAAPWFDKVPM